MTETFTQKMTQTLVTLMLLMSFMVGLTDTLSFASEYAPTTSHAPVLASDEIEFLESLSKCIKESTPFVIDDGAANEPFKAFASQYKGNLSVESSNDNANTAIDTNKAFDADSYSDTANQIILVTDTSDKRLLAMATHVSSIEGSTLFVQDLSTSSSSPTVNSTDSFTDSQTDSLNTADQIIVIGTNTLGSAIDVVENYVTYEEVRKWYEDAVGDTVLDVYVASDALYIAGVYLAALREGRLIFDSDALSPSEQTHYFAWVVSQNDFTVEKLEALQHKLDTDSDGHMDVSLGIITGKNAQQANLLVARSFFYAQMAKKNQVTAINAESADNYESDTFDDWTYVLAEGKEANKEEVVKQLGESAYIKLCGHGMPKSFLLGDGSYLNGKDFPMLYSAVLIFEACYTGGFGEQGSMALDAIEKGAVAYVGSVKNGGVTNPLRDGISSHFLTTQDVTIGDFVSFHNYGIKENVENFERAILIGDPMWHAFERAGDWQNLAYHVDLPTGDLFKVFVPISINESLQIKGFDVLRISDRRIVFVESEGPSAIIDLKKGLSLTQLLDKASNRLYISYQFVFGELMAFDLLLIAFAAALLFAYGFILNTKKGMDKARIIRLIVYVGILILFEHYFMEMKFVLFKTIVYALIIDVILESRNRIYGILAIDGLFVVILGLMLLILKVVIAMYLTLFIGIFVFTMLFGLIGISEYFLTLTIKTRCK